MLLDAVGSVDVLLILMRHQFHTLWAPCAIATQAHLAACCFAAYPALNKEAKVQTWTRLRVPLGAALSVAWVLVVGASFAVGRPILGALWLTVAAVWALIAYRWWSLGERP